VVDGASPVSTLTRVEVGGFPWLPPASFGLIFVLVLSASLAALSVLEVITSLAGSAPDGGHSRSRCLEGNEAKSQQSDARFSLGRASRYHLSPYF
jgi:hypothetical protein